MGVTVFHSLTATTPDNTQYEIRPSNWNSGHAVSMSLAGSDISNAFTNSPTVTFGSSGAYVTASVNTSYIPLGNSSSIMPIASSSNFLGTGATGSFINTSVSSSIMPIASSSNFLGTGATGSFINTSVSSSIMPIASSSNFIAASVSSSIMPIVSSSNFLGSAASGSFVNTSVSSRFAGTGTTFSGTNVSGSMTLNSNGLNLALSAGAGGGGNFSAGISTGGNTSGNTGTVSNQIVFVGGNNVTLSGSTAAGGATVTISGANIGGAQTGISGVAVSNTTYTSGTFSFRDGNNISFASGTGQGVSITHNLQSAGAYLTTAMQSQSSSVFAKTGFTSATTAGTAIVATHDTNGLSMGVPAYITTFTSPTSYVSNVNGSSGAVSVAGLNSGFTNLTATYNTSGLSISAPATSSLSGTGALSISVTSNTISIGVPAVSMGISGGNTSGNTGTVSNQFVLAGGNNVTLSGSTNAGGMTVTISANTAAAANLSVSAGASSGAFGGVTFSNSNNVSFGLNNGTITASASFAGAAQTGISGMVVSNTTYTSGTVSFRDGNNISFASGTGQGVSITHNLQSAGAYLTTAMQSQSSSVFAKTGFTSATTAGTAIVATHDTNGLSMGVPAYITTYVAQTAQTGISSIALSGTTYTNGSVSFRDGNNISFSSGTGNAISITHNLQSAGAYLTTAMQSQSSSVFAKTGFTSATTVGTAIVATHDTNGLSMGVPAYITTFTSPTSYVSNVNGSSGAISVAGTGFTSTTTGGTAVVATLSTNGLSMGIPAYLTAAGGVQTAISGVALNGTTYTSGTVSFRDGNNISFSSGTGQGISITHNLQSAGAYLTTAMQSQSSSVFAKTGFTSTTTGGTAVVGTLNTNGLSMGIPAYITTYAAQTNQTVGFYGSSQTTGQSSSSTFDARSMTFVGAGGVSIGASNGSIIFSGATGGGGGGGGGIALGNSQTTYTSGTVALSEGGGAITIASNTGQRIDISVPSVSSLYGASGIIVTTNGGSISIANEHNSYWIPAQLANSTYLSLDQNRLYLLPMFPQDNYSFSGVQQIWSLSASGTGTNSSYSIGHTLTYGMYEELTTSVDQLVMLYSSTMYMAASVTSTAASYTIAQGTNSFTTATNTAYSSVFSGQKVVDIPFAVSMEDGHHYYFAMLWSSNGSNTNNTRMPVRASMIMNAEITNASFGFMNPSTIITSNSTIGPAAMPCAFSATTGAFPATISSNQTVVTASNASVYVFFKN